MRGLIWCILALVAVSCRKQQTATVEVLFQTELNGDPFDWTEAFADAQGRLVYLELLWFYVADISFVAKSGDVHSAKDIALLRLSASGKASLSLSVPAGDYTDLSCGIGVPKALNATDPAAFNEADHPLNVLQQTYWGMNGRYRFVMMDGRYDAEGDGVTDGTFSYHTGYDASYRTTTFAKEMTFKAGETTPLTVGIDVAILLQEAKDGLDLAITSNYHGSLGDSAISQAISNRFKHSLSLKD